MVSIKQKLKFTFATALLVVFVVTGNAYAAFVPYRSYNYDSDGKTRKAPEAYVPDQIHDGNTMGTGLLSNPSDLFVRGDGSEAQIYIADTGNNRIICLDSSFKVKWTMDSVGESPFNKPEGIFVDRAGEIYISDTGIGRIVHVDSTGRIVKEIYLSAEEALVEDFVFKPGKLAADRGGNIYCVSLNANDGILTFSKEGKFLGFTGANKVVVNPVEYFWKMISVREEQERMRLFVPTEFSGLDIDEDDFIYTATSKYDLFGGVHPIRRQNPSGDDVLRWTGSPPRGDLVYSWDPTLGGYPGQAEFIDVCVQNDGVYSGLDRNRGKYNGRK
jgi:hypothetical protein